MYYTDYRGQKFKMKADICSFFQKGITKSTLNAKQANKNGEY